MVFQDRVEAGRLLGSALTEYANRSDVQVLALPRGGVPVGFEVAQALHAPLDVFVVRKLGVPTQPELAMGAIASGGIRVLNAEVLRAVPVPEQQLEAVTAEETRELGRRELEYRGNRPPPELRGRVAILVDDGLATGSTMRAAVAALRQRAPAEIVVAVPVAARATCELMREEADKVVCLYAPHDFYAVGEWYRQFSQTSDQEVRDLLDRASAFGATTAKL